MLGNDNNTQEDNNIQENFRCNVPTGTALRHERELSSLTTMTHTLSEQNSIIAESLNAFSSSIMDLKIVISQQQENIKGFVEVKTELGEFNHTVMELKSAIKDLQEDLKDRDRDIRLLKVDTSHLGWINKGIKKVTDNAGFILVLSILAILFANNKLILDIIKSMMSFF
jgi:predicted RNase H-like nuclease (RuvC/YqgF family)